MHALIKHDSLSLSPQFYSFSAVVLISLFLWPLIKLGSNVPVEEQFFE